MENPYLRQPEPHEANPYTHTTWGEGSAHLPGLALRALARVYDFWTENQRNFLRADRANRNLVEHMVDPDSIPPHPEEQRFATNYIGDMAAGFAGPIRWSLGKLYPKAFQVRGIRDPKELDWLADVYRTGIPNEKPTSPLTPEYLMSFSQRPYGVLWDVKKPSNVRYLNESPGTTFEEPMFYPWDEGIRPYQKKPPEDWLEQYKRAKQQANDADEIVQQYENYDDLSPEDIIELEKAEKLSNKALEDLERLEDAWPHDPEKWHNVPEPVGFKWSAHPWKSYADPLKKDLPDIFRTHRDYALARTGNRQHVPDAVYSIGDPTELAGVRVPLPGSPDVDDDLARALIEFANHRRLPIYELPNRWTGEEHLRMLDDVIASGAQGGEWVPTGQRTITSFWGQ